MMAALGSCSHFDTASDESNIHVMLTEDTTVAAAYALGNFMYVNDNGGTGQQLVFVSAPPNNNAATGSCTSGKPGASMTCTAAGLSHAFANAANLVNAVSYTGGYPQGTPNNTPPSNTTFGTVPVALINTLGNIVQACTNSQSSGSTPSTVCSTLFTDATPNSESNNVTAVPVDTLQAVMAIAKSPQHIVSTIYGLATPNSFFQPALTAAPHDWTIAITYAPVSYASTNTSQAAVPITAYNVTSTSAVTFTAANSLVNGQQVFVTGFPTSTALNGLTFTVSAASGTSFVGTLPFGAVLPNGTSATESASAYIDNPLNVSIDANDNIYVTGSDGASPTQGGMSALRANGAPVWTNVLNTSTCQPQQSAPDTNGNVWMTSDQSSTGCGGSGGTSIVGFATSSGAAANATFPTGSQETQVDAIAVDRFNNLWSGRLSSNCGNTLQCIYEFPCTYSTSCTYGRTSQSNVTGSTCCTGLDNIGYMTIDANQNIYFSSNPGSGTSTLDNIFVYQNTGTASAPTYANSASTGYSDKALQYGGYGAVALDGIGNVWGGTVGTANELSEIPITYSGAAASLGTVNNFTPGTAASHPTQGLFDGLGTFWYPSSTSSGQLYYYVPSSSAAKDINPCYIPASATGTACTAFLSTYDPRNLVIDSTGSIWTVSALAGEVVQIIGAAAPVWPQQSYAVFGTLPQ